MKDLMSKIQPHIDNLKKSFQGILSKFSKSGELDDDEELFDDEIVASDDDEKTVVHNLAAMKEELAAASEDETETSSDMASAIADSEDETVSTDVGDDTSTDVAEGELTQQFDVEGTHADFTAADLGLDEDDEDDEFESGLGSNRNSMIIRAVVILAIVWYALDEFVLKKDAPVEAQQQVAQQNQKPKRKRVRKKQPQAEQQMEQQVAQATPTPTPEPTAEPQAPEQEPQLAQESQMPAEQVTDSNMEPLNQQSAEADPLQNNEIANADNNEEMDTSNQDSNPGMEIADQSADAPSQDSMDTPTEDSNIADNTSNDSSAENSDDEIAGKLGISPVAKMQLQEELEKAQARIAELQEQNQDLLRRKPASNDSDADSTPKENSVLTELQLKARQKKLSKESLAFIKVMIPDPAVDYEFSESPDFTLTNVPVGRGLVYNCSGGHWACVPKELYYQCRDHARWSISKKKSPDCVVNSVYTDLKACKEAQSLKIGQLAEADFCENKKADSEREPASVEVDDSNVPYETGL